MSVNTRGKKVNQTINLKDFFGTNISSEPLKERIGQFLIDRIKSRTSQGVDINGNAFVGYSKAYQSSDEFLAARKSGGVNMKLSGDMLGSIDILEIKGNSIKIGFADREEELKAHGHMTGGGKNNSLPVREFFGITDRDLEEANKKFEALINKSKETKK